MNAPVMAARDLAQHYQVGGNIFTKPRTLKAVAGLDFELYPGKTLAVVGESGCGKSTLARMVTMIEEPTRGALLLDGKEVTRDGWADLRTSVQIVFQDPYGSLNPRQRIGQILQEPLIINRPDMSDKRTRGKGARNAAPRRPARRNITTAIRICSRAASASASPWPAP